MMVLCILLVFIILVLYVKVSNSPGAGMTVDQSLYLVKLISRILI